MNIPTADILDQDLYELPISRSLLLLFEQNQLQTLKDLVNRPVHEWFRFTGFSQHLLNEIMNFLEEQSLSSYIKD